MSWAEQIFPRGFASANIFKHFADIALRISEGIARGRLYPATAGTNFNIVIPVALLKRKIGHWNYPGFFLKDFIRHLRSASTECSFPGNDTYSSRAKTSFEKKVNSTRAVSLIKGQNVSKTAIIRFVFPEIHHRKRLTIKEVFLGCV
jgi:hypothetical protein